MSVEDIWDAVDASGDCWLWTATVSDQGYGRTRDSRYAHRVIWELLVGPIPAGLQLDHLCRVRRCVNPDHLEPVTNRVNALRGSHPLAVLFRLGQCARGHSLDDAYVRKSGSRMCRACRRVRYSPGDRRVRYEREAARGQQMAVAS